ncbi:DUF2637 domain-containing protein [Salininema proteolyticum]|uniref:DUF2637 domain-containing protein n=1 Tax=Salininema proteolyticum TaxID=1607685 RepID=A0ABV8TZS7_9ACTN
MLTTIRNNLNIIVATVVSAVTAWISFSHIIETAIKYGQSPSLAYCYPVAVDGMVVAGALYLNHASKTKRRVAYLAFALGIFISLACNMAVAEFSIGAQAVAAIPAISLLVVFELIRPEPAEETEEAGGSVDHPDVAATTGPVQGIVVPRQAICGHHVPTAALWRPAATSNTEKTTPEMDLRRAAGQPQTTENPSDTNVIAETEIERSRHAIKNCETEENDVVELRPRGSATELQAMAIAYLKANPEATDVDMAAHLGRATRTGRRYLAKARKAMAANTSDNHNAATEVMHVATRQLSHVGGHEIYCVHTSATLAPRCRPAPSGASTDSEESRLNG